MTKQNTQEIFSRATEAMRELHERATELELENAELRKKLGMPERPKDVSSAFDVLAITNVQIFPFKEGMSLGKIKALANIVLNDQLQIRGLRVVDGQNGMFVGYPIDAFYKGEESRYICMPITKALREHIENCVLEKYQYTIEGRG